MTKYLLLLLTAIGFAQSKQEIKEAKGRRDTYLFAASTMPKKFNGSVPIEIVSDELLIQVTIHGKPYTFLFDTGAITILSDGLRKELGLAVATSNKLTDAAGNVSSEDFYMIDELKLGEVTFSKVAAGSFSLDSFSLMLCRKIDGIFGSNLMRLGNWKVDYLNSKLSFSTDKLLPDSEFDTIDFDEGFSGTPVVFLDTGGYRFPAMIDTGNNGTIDMPEDLYQKTRLSKSGKFQTSYGKGFFSLSGNKEQTERLGTADSLYLGNRLLRDQRLRISPSPMILVGNEFLKQFGEIGISWKKKEMYLPKKTLPLETEWSFGFTPLKDDGKIKVAVIWEKSPAKQKGLEIGDVILAINGQDVAGSTDEFWCGMRERFKKESSLELEIEKANGQRKMVLLDRYDLLKP
ncbi:aspartyl protease family protein [Flavobacterium silvaticum]|uniref:PDZ domain-containing protein n=1 Tax=Flavobacterium silvaticum TaxID=1852020 RepID=A0A972FRG8_9FLAO|nr:aspartyl protease family protein [Flavobacterium silvaticum]NMH26647.1 PDZ domain-containing protein [Flavobacterium silvaticum]